MNENNVFIICIAVLCVLFGGTPDLMDGIVAHLSK